MGRKRKTFDIAELLYTVNCRNAGSTCSPDVRQGWNSLLETVLHGADLYNGYGYLEQKNLKGSAVNSRPGIEFVSLPEWIEDTREPSPCDSVIEAREFFDTLDALNARLSREGKTGVHTPPHMHRRFPDESRRVYYVPQTLRDAYSKLEAEFRLGETARLRALKKDMLERSRRPEEKGVFSS
jgi:hypothetical protein